MSDQLGGAGPAGNPVTQVRTPLDPLRRLAGTSLTEQSTRLQARALVDCMAIRRAEGVEAGAGLPACA